MYYEALQSSVNTVFKKMRSPFALQLTANSELTVNVKNNTGWSFRAIYEMDS